MMDERLFFVIRITYFPVLKETINLSEEKVNFKNA